jgi:hypothetical protein
MLKCQNCGAVYHYGLVHQCPTSAPMLTLQFPQPLIPTKQEIYPVKFNQELIDYLNQPREEISPREKKELKKGLEALKTEEGELFKPIHAHCAWFGSELACQECNPCCYQNHQMGNPDHLKWCGMEDCPLGPKKMKERMTKDGPMSKELQDEMDAWERASMEDWKEFEEEEDKIRKLKRKSIREGGKYKSRGKEKRREP